MGILDIFGGGKSPERATRLKSKVTQKYGGPEARQKAIQQLGEMDFPEATASLLARFTITVDPQTTDTDEKEHVFGLIRARGEAAVDPIRAFLRRTDQASSWAMRLLRELLPADRYVTAVVEHLRRAGGRSTPATRRRSWCSSTRPSRSRSPRSPPRPPLPRGHGGRREDRRAPGARAEGVSRGSRADARRCSPHPTPPGASRPRRSRRLPGVGSGSRATARRWRRSCPNRSSSTKPDILKRRGAPAAGQSE